MSTAVVAPRERRTHPDHRHVADLERLRLLVVAAHPSVRRSLRDLLDDQQDFSVLASASTAESALLAARRTTPDVAVVDYELDDHSGLWLSRQLKRLPRPPRVVLCSEYADSLRGTAMLAAGADAVLDIATLGGVLCEIVRLTAAGPLATPTLPWAS